MLEFNTFEERLSDIFFNWLLGEIFVW